MNYHIILIVCLKKLIKLYIVSNMNNWTYKNNYKTIIEIIQKLKEEKNIIIELYGHDLINFTFIEMMNEFKINCNGLSV